jgi:predicted HTH transcriptional regulator
MTETFAKRIKDDIARFVADPTRDGLQNLIRYFGGEFDQYELKEAWPVLPRIAKTALAIANSGGGIVLFGIRDQSLEPVGLAEFQSKQQVFDVFGRFIPAALLDEVTLLDFDYNDTEYAPLRGKKVQVLAIPDLPNLLPFVCDDDWKQDDATLRRGAIYVRTGTNTVEADYAAVQRILKRRIESEQPSGNVASLSGDLAQLQALYLARQRAAHAVYWRDSDDGASDAFVPEPRLLEFLDQQILAKQTDIADLLTS